MSLSGLGPSGLRIKELSLFQVVQLPSILPPAGAPQRVSGKVSGTVTVGTTPVVLDNIDLHAYIVVGDGRAYTAISEVSALALLPSVKFFTVQWVKTSHYL